jgi:hypothetical protein
LGQHQLGSPIPPQPRAAHNPQNVLRQNLCVAPRHRLELFRRLFHNRNIAHRYSLGRSISASLFLSFSLSLYLFRRSLASLPLSASLPNLWGARPSPPDLRDPITPKMCHMTIHCLFLGERPVGQKARKKWAISAQCPSLSVMSPADLNIHNCTIFCIYHTFTDLRVCVQGKFLTPTY